MDIEPKRMLDTVRRRRNRKLASGGAIIALSISAMIGVGVFAGQQWRDADEQVVDVAAPSESGPTSASSTNGDDTDESTTVPAVPPTFEVPDLVGLSVADAVAALKAAGASGSPALFSSRYVASSDVPAGVIFAQRPPNGTALGRDLAVEIDVSAGGPAASFEELPPPASEHATSLPDFDRTEPILLVETTGGIAYKTDGWLFGPCAATDEAYRTFPDPQYGTDCY